jgi:hypothetical protein
MRIDLDHRAIDRLKRHPGVIRYCQKQARQVVFEIRRKAPVRTGEYRDSWEVHIDRLGRVRIVSSSWKVWFIEKGARPHGGHPGVPAFHVVLRSLRAVGRREL